MILALWPMLIWGWGATAPNEILVSFSTMNGQLRTFYVPEMRNVTAASLSSSSSPYEGTHLRWHSPALYLFAGVAGMLALIGLTSMVLLCFWWRRGDGHVEANDPERVSPGIIEGKEENLSCEIDKEAKVLVIMPGDEKPSFLAKELSSPSTADGSGV